MTFVVFYPSRSGPEYLDDVYRADTQMFDTAMKAFYVFIYASVCEADIKKHMK